MFDFAFTKQCQSHLRFIMYSVYSLAHMTSSPGSFSVQVPSKNRENSFTAFAYIVSTS